MNDGFEFLPTGTLLEDEGTKACACGGTCGETSGAGCGGGCGCSSKSSCGAGCGSKRRDSGGRPQGSPSPLAGFHRPDGFDRGQQGLGMGGSRGELGDGLSAHGPRTGDPRHGGGRGDGLGAVPGQPGNRGGSPPWRWQDYGGQLWDPSGSLELSGCPLHCVILHSLCRECLDALPPPPVDDDYESQLKYWLAKEACASSCRGYRASCGGFFPECPPIYEQFLSDPPGRDPGYDPDIDWCSEPGWLGVDQEVVGDAINYCCYLHDKCYEAGSRKQSRGECDWEFGWCMFDAGWDLVALTYYVAVRLGGIRRFNYNELPQDPPDDGPMDQVFGSPWGRK